MAARSPRRSKKHEPRKATSTGVLDWSGSEHWGRRPLPCRYQCGYWPTQLRDSKGRPAHKVCAEAAFTQQAQDAAEAYENERLRLA